MLLTRAKNVCGGGGRGGGMSFNVFVLKITSECIFFILESDIADNTRYLSV